MNLESLIRIVHTTEAEHSWYEENSINNNIYWQTTQVTVSTTILTRVVVFAS